MKKILAAQETAWIAAESRPKTQFPKISLDRLMNDNLAGLPTSPFKNFEPQNPCIDIFQFHLVQERRASDY